MPKRSFMRCCENRYENNGREVSNLKIYYIVKNLDKIPSCAYNIQMLKKIGYDVVAVLGSSTEGINHNFSNDSIPFTVMTDYSEKSGKRSSLSYLLGFRRFLKKTLENTLEKDDILFLGTADTAVAMLGMFKKSKKILSIKELYDNDRLYRKILIRLCRKADAVVACEINRARMMQFEWGLEKRPFVIPNKPYFHPRKPDCTPTTQQTERVIEQIKGKPCIIYQANHIRFANELKNLAEALNAVPVKYTLVLIGTVDNAQDIEELKKIYPDIVVTGYIFSPLHMEVTSYAKIGITVYSDNSLNNLFCAPNKIYEYAGYGVPTLANDIPGLIQTIGLSGAGECVNWDDPTKIAEAIIKIENNYEEYSLKSTQFFDSVDNSAVLNNIIETVNKKKAGIKND